MRRFHRLISLILCLLLSVTLWPVNAVMADDAAGGDTIAESQVTENVTEENASSEETEESTTETAQDITEETSVPVDAAFALISDGVTLDSATAEVTADPIGGEDNDELFAGYVDQLFGDNLYTEPTGVFFAAARNNKDKLTPLCQGLYDGLLPQISQVAAGQVAETTFKVTAAQLGLTAHYTAADLGLDKMNSSNAQDIIAAMKEKVKLSRGDYNTLMYALLADVPYELYWFDKTIPSTFTPNLYKPNAQGKDSSVMGHSDGQGGFDYVYWDPDSYFQISLKVSKDYSQSGEADTTTADTAKLSAASTAAKNAQAIVDKFASWSDYDKLCAYADAVCNLASYNSAATTSTPYGDPWQLIWVFDGDASTKVVCEGYAKAFKYLCDISAFDNKNIYTYIGTGSLYVGGTNRGDHMYNIVTMENGLNYLVDLTNSDTDAGSVSFCNNKVFLKGASGSPATRYTVSTSPSSLGYSYDVLTTGIFSADELTISSTDYRPAAGTLSAAVNYTQPLACNTPITFTVTPVNGSGAAGSQVAYNGAIKSRYQYQLNSVQYLLNGVYEYEYDYTDSAPYGDLNKFEYTFMASGKYRLKFSVMDFGARPTLATASVTIDITISDEAYPDLNTLAANIMAQCTGTTDYEKALYAHDWIVANAKYDNFSGFDVKGDTVYINDLKNQSGGLSAGLWIGPTAILARGLGVCESYVSAFSLLLKTVGIDSERVAGSASVSNHAWSRIKLDGEWTLVDVTWDDDSATTSRYNQHLYFGITDDMMLKVHTDHKASATKPCTTFTNNYFLKSGDITAFSDSIKTKIQAELAKGSTDFTVPADYNMYPNFYYIVYPLVAYYLTNTDGDMIAEGVEVSYAFNDALSDKWNAQDYSVKVKDIKSISLVTEPTKKAYFDKEDFDPTGGKVKVVYQDDTYGIKDLAGFTINGYDPDTIGTQTISVSLNTFTAPETFSITVSHNIVTDAAVAPTCTEAGKTEGSHCENCGLVVVAQNSISALTHSWDSGVVKTAATCTKTGEKVYTCSRCKAARSETIPMAAHNSNGKAAHKDATCTTAGVTGGAYCTACNNGKAAAEKVIPALGHAEVKDKAVEATYKSTGLTEGSHCTRCGAVIKAQETVPKLVLRGDANGDGKISALDYVVIKNHIMDVKKITDETRLKAADANLDGKISALDYVKIKNYIMKGGW